MSEKKPYFIGLDVGTDSVGFAAADEDYRLLRLGGKTVWGMRLFDEAQTAESRRMSRTARRRLARRNQRLELLRAFFAAELDRVDPHFLTRMKESGLWEEDKTTGTAFSLFAGEEYTDKDFHREYPTAYHLRHRLLHEDGPFDVRLVYLALHHLFKNRGHFLFDIGEDDGGDDTAEELRAAAEGSLALSVDGLDDPEIVRIVGDRKTGIRQKKAALSDRLRMGDCSFDGEDGKERDEKQSKACREALVGLLCGGSVSAGDLFCDPELKKEKKKLCLTDAGFEEAVAELSDRLGDRTDVLLYAKRFYDTAIVAGITGSYDYLCDYKIAEYECHKAQLKELKTYIRTYGDDALYRTFFNLRSEKLANYAAYSGYRKADEIFSADRDSFYGFLKKNLPQTDTEIYREILQAIENKTYLPKLRTSENGMIPCALLKKEVEGILKKAQGWLPFLSERDAEGLSVSEKLLAAFSFRIPYYVGPLNASGHSPNAWIVRKEGKILPWNFDAMVDLPASAEQFVRRMTAKCNYTGEDVLPKDSLLYSEFCVLNEINLIKINGNPLPHKVKTELYRALFVGQSAPVTKKKIRDWLLSEGMIGAGDEIGGVDDRLTSGLSSYHRLKRILQKLGAGGRDRVEDMIVHIVLFGDDRALLRQWIDRYFPELSEEDRKYASRLRFGGWGSLSRALLTEIAGTDTQTGTVMTVMERLREEEVNLSALMGKRYTYGDAIEAYRRQREGNGAQSLDEMIDALYVSPKIRRSIRQTVRIVREITDKAGTVPEKIMIEVPRDQNGKNEKKATVSRKARLLSLYESCGEQANELYAELQAVEEDRLRQDRLYLYYTQFGKCMYSGEKIDLAKLNDQNCYDIDHIFPRSRIKDDSLDNRVLVRAELNREKTNDYPLRPQIREARQPFWKSLLDKGAISRKKYDRLIRRTPLTDEELSAFVNRQLVETRQSAKALAEILDVLYPETCIVYSKAGNVTDFRHFFDIRKCRDINDCHHAVDAYLNIVVGNFFHTRFTERFFAHIATENYSLNPEALYGHAVAGAWIPGERGSIATVKEMLRRGDMLYTEQPHEQGGALYDLQLMKKGKGQVPRKEGLDPERYGAYNKAAGAYFALVEHTKKEKRVRTIEAVYLYSRARYEADPEAYAASEWGCEDPRVILRKIYVNTLLEADGGLCYLRGRSGNQLIVMPAYQLRVSPTEEAALKEMLKYVSLCDEARRDDIPVGRMAVSAEKNEKLYEMFVSKLRAPAYARFFKAALKTLENGREAFAELPLAGQCRALREILKFFRCDMQHPDLKSIGGPGTAGVIMKNKEITAWQSAYLLHQSPAGLYRRRVDLKTVGNKA